MAVSVGNILSNLNKFADLGRQRAFELSNPYYYQFIQAFSKYVFRNDRLVRLYLTLLA